MVTRVLSLLYREIRGLHQAAYVLALFTLASQILAIVRDRVLAHQFGAGADLDIYYAAFRIPDLLFVLFASVLSVYVLLPFVTKAEQAMGGTGRVLLSQMFTLFLMVYTVAAAVIFFAAPLIVPRLFVGFDPSSYEQVTLLLRILLLQPLFLGISSLFGVVTQIHHRFVLYALSPLLYNIGIIIGAVFFYQFLGLAGLAVGVVLGACGHMLVQWPLVRTSNLAFSATWYFDWAALRSVVGVALPRALTLAVGQIQMLVFVVVASTMTVGSVAVLQLAYNLQSVPLAIIGMSYSVAAFPVLAELLARQEREKFNAYVATALRHIIFWSVPIAMLVIVLRAQMVRVILGSGSFNWDDTRLTAAALALFVVVLVAQSIILLLVRAFYAGGHTRLPLVITLCGAGAGLAAMSLFVTVFETMPRFAETILGWLRLTEVVGAEILMIPLGFMVGVAVELGVMLVLFARSFAFPLGTLARPFLQSVLAGLGGSMAAYGTLTFVVEGVNQETFIGIFLQGALAGAVGVGVTGFVYYFVRSPEMAEITKSFKARLFKTDVVAPQPDII